jgi:hypothetical protein
MKPHDGALKERLLNRGDELSISIATTERPWSFDGYGEAFKLTIEAKRIDLAFLFDPMMSVHTSNVELLPLSANRFCDISQRLGLRPLPGFRPRF